MKINGESITKYGASLLTFEMQGPQDAPSVEWVPNGLLPIAGASTMTFGTATAVLYFRGNKPDEIYRNAAQLLSMLEGEAILEVPGYRGEYVGYLTGNDLQKILRSKTRRKLTLTFKGYLRGEKQYLEFFDEREYRLERIGARPTPVILTIYSMQALESATIGGLTETPIVIRNIPATTHIRIDGRDGTAWIQPTSTGIMTPDETAWIRKAQDVDMWEPPAIRSPVLNLTVSEVFLAVTVEYWPIWM